MSNLIAGRKHSFSVLLPKKLHKHTDTDLRLMLVSLKNAMMNCSVYISKIERELKQRGVDPSILPRSLKGTQHEYNDDSLSEIQEFFDTTHIPPISKLEVRIDGNSGCTLCGHCLEICLYDALEIVENSLIVHQDKCRSCGVCITQCPQVSLELIVQ